MVFGAAGDGSCLEPWISDGTPTGTRRLADLSPGGASNPEQFAVIGDRLYFSAEDRTSGMELFGMRLATLGLPNAEVYGGGCPGARGLPRIGWSSPPLRNSQLSDCGWSGRA